MSNSKYENAIVTYLDILAFKNLIEKVSDKDIELILNDIKEAVEPIKLPAGLKFKGISYEPIVYIFSDSIIRVRPIERKDNLEYQIGLFFHELLDLLHIQGKLISNKLLLRGAVSYGRVSISNARVFGPALVSAVELEEKCAIYPRIIVDPKLIKTYNSNRLLRQQDDPLKTEKEYIVNLLRQGDDSFWFVDYLHAISEEFNDFGVYFNFLFNHRQLIIDGAKGLKLPQGTMKKYMWLARYHNDLIASIDDKHFKDYSIDRNELIITENDIETLVEI